MVDEIITNVVNKVGEYVAGEVAAVKEGIDKKNENEMQRKQEVFEAYDGLLAEIILSYEEDGLYFLHPDDEIDDVYGDTAEERIRFTGREALRYYEENKDTLGTKTLEAYYEKIRKGVVENKEDSLSENEEFLKMVREAKTAVVKELQDF